MLIYKKSNLSIKDKGEEFKIVLQKWEGNIT